MADEDTHPDPAHVETIQKRVDLEGKDKQSHAPSGHVQEHMDGYEQRAKAHASVQMNKTIKLTEFFRIQPGTEGVNIPLDTLFVSNCQANLADANRGEMG